MNDYKEGFRMFSVVLRNELDSKDSNVKNHENISSVLNEYLDVFPEDLPEGLPARRTETDFLIELREEIKTIRKGLYCMSSTELAEIKKQVKYLIEMGFVRPRKRPWEFPVLFASRKDGSLRFCV